MQTRKSQKNQEASYVNMLKLHRDLIRCRDIIEMVRKREAKKVELLRIRKEIIDTRFAMKDWTGALLAKCTPQPVLKMQLPMRLPSGMLDGAAAFDSEHRNGPSSHPAYHPAMSPDSARRRMGGNKGKRKAREDDSPSIFGRPSKYALHEGYDEESDDDEEASSESSAVTEDECVHRTLSHTHTHTQSPRAAAAAAWRVLTIVLGVDVRAGTIEMSHFGFDDGSTCSTTPR